MPRASIGFMIEIFKCRDTEALFNGRRIGEIAAGKRAVTTDTGLRLSRFFGMDDAFWTGLQTDHDLAMARASMSDVLVRIQPWNGAERAAA